MLLFRPCPFTIGPSADLDLEGARVNNEDGLGQAGFSADAKTLWALDTFEGMVNRIPY